MKIATEDGQFELNTPRGRGDSFEPQLIKKGQTRFISIDDKILSLYAKGMTTQEIVVTFKEIFGADVSPMLISKVTDAVMEKVDEFWLDVLTELQNRGLKGFPDAISTVFYPQTQTQL